MSFLRFCDKEVYTIEYGSYSRSEIISFFLNDHTEDIILMYRDGNYYGMLRYFDLLRNKDLDKAIFTETIVLSDDMWETAHYTLSKCGAKLLPVVDTNSEIISFCYEDDNDMYLDELMLLENIDKLALVVNKVLWIKSFNEYTYRLYLLCSKNNIKVCVWGELWSEVGIQNKIDINDYFPEEIYTVYSDGTEYVKREVNDGYHVYKTSGPFFKVFKELLNAHKSEDVTIWD